LASQAVSQDFQREYQGKKESVPLGKKLPAASKRYPRPETLETNKEEKNQDNVPRRNTLLICHRKPGPDKILGSRTGPLKEEGSFFGNASKPKKNATKEEMNSASLS